MCTFAESNQNKYTMKKYITETSKDYSLLDNHTGEIIEFKQTKEVTIDEFIMVFFNSFSHLFKLSGNEIKVLMCCWKMSSYNPFDETEGNVVHNNGTFKDYCNAQELGLSKATIDNVICRLCKKGLLIKRCKGEYMLNPEYFFKGKLSNRSKIEYSFLVEPAQP